MIQWRAKFILFISLLCPLIARAQDADYHPHGLTAQLYYMETAEQVLTEDLERDAARTRDEYGAEKNRVDRQIAQRRFQIEQLQLRQSKAKEETAKLKSDLQQVQVQASDYEQQFEKTATETAAALNRLDAERTQLEADRKKMERTLAALTELRKRAENETATALREIKGLQAEKSRLENDIAAAESGKTAAESATAGATAEWVKSKMALAVAQRRLDVATALAKEARLQRAQAQKDLSEAKTALANTPNHPRQPASDTPAQVENGRRIWRTQEKCKAYSQPSTEGQAIGYFESGRNLRARDKAPGWTEISNGAGKIVYVESSCGKYAN